MKIQADSLDDSPTLAINEKVHELQSRGESIYHLGFGESRFPVHPLLVEALSKSAHHKSYLPVTGLPKLRQAVAAQLFNDLDLPLDPDQVIIAPGSKPLLFALQLNLNAELVVPAPAWVSYTPQARMLDRPVRVLQARLETDYAMDLEAIERAFHEYEWDRKLLVVNSPNNPTGRMLNHDEVRDLAQLCRQHRILVLSDEIYYRVVHGDREHVSIGRYYPEGTIIFGGLSKHLSLGGWRIGHAVFPEALKGLQRQVTAIASEIWSTASAPIQYAAVTAYSGDPALEAYRQDCTSLHQARTRYLWSGLRDLGIRCPEPHGGFYLMPDFANFRPALAAKGVTTSTQLAHYLLERYKLATLPGEPFGLPADTLAFRLATSYLDLASESAAEAMIRDWQVDPDPNTFFLNPHPEMQAVLSQFERFVAEHAIQ